MKRYHHKYTLPAIITLLILAIAFLLIGFFNFKRQTTLIVPAVNSRSSKYLKSMSKFVGMLQQRNKKVMVEVDQRYRRYFDNQTMCQKIARHLAS